MVTETIDIAVRSRGARVVKRNLAGIGDAAVSATRSLRLMQNALFVIGGAGAISSLRRSVDMLTNYENRLKLVTDSSSELEQVQSSLFAISKRTRTAFDATADVYARTALSVRNLGISQAETLQFTESLNKAVILSGASAREAHAAMIQLGQGLASNRLSGDELRSVLEQLPFVADVIARSMGVTRGELRAMGKEGKITALTVLKAFRDAREEIAEKFANTVPTIAQAFTVFHTNILEILDAFDDFTGSSAAIARAIIELGDSLKVVVAAGLAAASIFAGLQFAKLAAGLRVVIARERELAVAVKAGNATLLTATEMESARAASLLNTAQAKASATQTTLRNTVAKQADLQATLRSTEAELAAARANVQLQAGIAKTTGVTSQLTAAHARQTAALATNLRTVRALRATTTELAGAQATAAAATNSLAAAQARAATATKATAGATATLARALPALGAAVAAVGRLITFLGGPFNVAIAAIIAGMFLIESRSSRIDSLINQIDQSVENLVESFNQAGQSVEALRVNLNATTATQAILKAKEATALFDEELGRLEAKITRISFSSFGTKYRADLQLLSTQLRAGRVSFDEFKKAVDQFGISDPKFATRAADLQKMATHAGEAKLAMEQANDIVIVLTGTSEAAAAAMARLAGAAGGAAGAVSSLAGAAAGAIGPLQTLVNLIPAAAKASKAITNVRIANKAFAAGQAEINTEFKRGAIGTAERIASMDRLKNTYRSAIREIDGTAEATRGADKALKSYVSSSNLGALTGKAAAVARAKNEYNGIVTKLREAKAGQDQLNAASSAYKQNLSSINAQFAKKGGGGGGGGGTTSLEAQKRILEEISQPLQTYQNHLANLNTLLQQGKISQDQFTDSMLKARITYLESQKGFGAGVERGFLKILQSSRDLASQSERIVTRLFDGMSDAIANFVVTGKLDFRSLIQEITKMIVKLIVSQAFRSLFGGLFGGGKGGLLGGLFGGLFGQGAAFTGSGVQPFAKGGVVNDPTLFPFANGGRTSLGLMGEAGPEAILPLQRAPDGRLGVVSSGGGSIVNNWSPTVVTNVEGGGGSSEENNDLASRITDAVQDRLEMMMDDRIAQSQAYGGFGNQRGIG